MSPSVSLSLRDAFTVCCRALLTSECQTWMAWSGPAGTLAGRTQMRAVVDTDYVLKDLPRHEAEQWDSAGTSGNDNCHCVR